MTIAFEVNTTYSCRSYLWSFTVIRRTEKSVWIQEAGSSKIVRKKINVWDGCEQCFPLGIYSMAPILRAEKEDIVAY